MVRAAEGSGLGLSIVKEILTLHKVDFGVDSTVGEGTSFWFELPFVKVEKDKQNNITFNNKLILDKRN